MATRSLITIFILVTGFLFMSIWVFTLNVAGGASDAKLDQVVLTPTPSQIGVGGEVTLDAAVYIYGGCCYHLWAYDVTPELTLPENAELISGPTPTSFDKVDGIPGGEPVVVHFYWKVKSMEVGLHTFNVTIKTDNCGSVSTNCTMSIVHGCAISEPEEFHTSKGDTVITVFADSYIEGIDVDKVGLYYTVARGASKSDESKFIADNDTLLRDSTMDHGERVDTVPVEFNDGYWRGIIDTPDDISTVYYWIVATDNNGKNTTTQVYRFIVEDEEKRDLVVSITFWSLVFGTILGIIAIVMLYKRFHSSSSASDQSKGFLLLGMSRNPGIIKNLQRTIIDPSFQRRLRNRRLVIGAIVAALGIALLLWGISTGQFGTMMTHMKEGK